ncbi:MAG: hypothetical protein M3071_17390 [Actinomycetota bacterium]|nr:hypothetical protein [Actinomycetota bacterium]
MRWRRDPKSTRVPGEYPESFTKRFMARTLPSATPTQAASAVRHLRSQGWTEEQLAEFILPFMPQTDQAPHTPADPTHAISLPPDVTRAWLDRHLPALDRYQLRRIVDELEHRGWPTGTVATIVLPHLLPKLPPDDARAIVVGLAHLGMTEEEISRATTLP